MEFRRVLFRSRRLCGQWPVLRYRRARDRRGGVQRPRKGFGDRKSVVKGKSVSVRVDLGGRRIIKKKNINIEENNTLLADRSELHFRVKQRATTTIKCNIL